MKQTKYIKLKRNKITVGKCKLEINNKREAWLEEVLIYKKFRGLGYSKYLLRKAIYLMKRMKILTIYLHVKHDNYIAIKSYKKLDSKLQEKTMTKINYLDIL